MWHSLQNPPQAFIIFEIYLKELYSSSVIKDLIHRFHEIRSINVQFNYQLIVSVASYSRFQKLQRDYYKYL